MGSIFNPSVMPIVGKVKSNEIALCLHCLTKYLVVILFSVIWSVFYNVQLTAVLPCSYILMFISMSGNLYGNDSHFTQWHRILDMPNVRKWFSLWIVYAAENSRIFWINDLFITDNQNSLHVQLSKNRSTDEEEYSQDFSFQIWLSDFLAHTN